MTYTALHTLFRTQVLTAALMVLAFMLAFVVSKVGEISDGYRYHHRRFVVILLYFRFLRKMPRREIPILPLKSVSSTRSPCFPYPVYYHEYQDKQGF